MAARSKIVTTAVMILVIFNKITTPALSLSEPVEILPVLGDAVAGILHHGNVTEDVRFLVYNDVRYAKKIFKMIGHLNS